MKNSKDAIGNRTRNLPACTTVLQPTVSPRTPSLQMYYNQIHLTSYTVLSTLHPLRKYRNIKLFKQCKSMVTIFIRYSDWLMLFQM